MSHLGLGPWQTGDLGRTSCGVMDTGRGDIRTAGLLPVKIVDGSKLPPLGRADLAMLLEHIHQAGRALIPNALLALKERHGGAAVFPHNSFCLLEERIGC